MDENDGPPFQREVIRIEGSKAIFTDYPPKHGVEAFDEYRTGIAGILLDPERLKEVDLQWKGTGEFNARRTLRVSLDHKPLLEVYIKWVQYKLDSSKKKCEVLRKAFLEEVEAVGKWEEQHEELKKELEKL